MKILIESNTKYFAIAMLVVKKDIICEMISVFYKYA